MSTIDVLWLAFLNRNTDDAGSDSTINLTINVDGEDVLDRDFGSNVGDGEAYLNGGNEVESPFDSATLTNSSVRIGVRDDDAWAPGDVLRVWPFARTSSVRALQCRWPWKAV